MQTTNVQPRRRALGEVLAPVMALLLLSVLAVPADAQRGGGQGGRGGSGQGHYGGGHRGGQSYGSHRHGGSRGAYGNHHRRGGYRGHYGAHRRGGYGGHHTSRGHYGYRGHHGYRSHYRGYYRYSSYYGYPSYYRPYDSYLYYSGPGTWGFGYRGYPVSIHYDAAPSYVVAGKTYPAPSYQSAIAIPERVVDENGEPMVTAGSRDAGGSYDARPQPARVKLTIEPADASVYLDGRFLGLASELPEELLLDPGSHRLEIARPGLSGRSLDLELDAGEELDVGARLEP